MKAGQIEIVGSPARNSAILGVIAPPTPMVHQAQRPGQTGPGAETEF
jgi:hypothetical protein